jgi:hypothetical protein
VFCASATNEVVRARHASTLDVLNEAVMVKTNQYHSGTTPSHKPPSPVSCVAAKQKIGLKRDVL